MPDCCKHPSLPSRWRTTEINESSNDSVCWQDTRERIEAHQLGGLTIVAVCRPRAKAHKSEWAQRGVGMMEPPQACSPAWALLRKLLAKKN